MFETFSSEKQKREVIRGLNISIAQWSHIVAEAIPCNGKKDFTFEYAGTEYDTSEWQNHCYLCENFGPSRHPCKKCPMSGLWTGRGFDDEEERASCHYSAFQDYVQATDKQEVQETAMVVLQDLLNAKTRYEHTKVVVDDVPKYFKLKPVSELLRMPDAKPMFKGTKVTRLSMEEDAIVEKMVNNWNKVLTYNGRDILSMMANTDKAGFSYLDNSDSWTYGFRWLDVCDEEGNVIRSLIEDKEETKS